MQLSSKIIELIEFIYESGHVTKSTRPFLSKIRYYDNIWYLRDCGIVAENGLTDDLQKKWILTEKGLKVAEHLKIISELCKGEHGGEV